MNRAEARAFLGIRAEAGAGDVMSAYGRRSRRLKHALVSATTVEARDRVRRALRNLMVLRDLALEPHEAHALHRRRAERRAVLVDDWWGPEDGVPPMADAGAAFAWLGVDRFAPPESVRRILSTRARKLKLRIAHAATEFDLRRFQQALSDLGRVAATALAAPRPTTVEFLPSADPSRPIDGEDTILDLRP
jgi:hypothetical protein